MKPKRLTPNSAETEGKAWRWNLSMRMQHPIYPLRLDLHLQYLPQSQQQLQQPPPNLSPLTPSPSRLPQSVHLQLFLFLKISHTYTNQSDTTTTRHPNRRPLRRTQRKRARLRNKIATPASPLMTIRPLKKVGSMANLSLAEPIGLNRPASPNPIYTPTPSRPGSPSHTVAQQRPLTTSDIFRPQSPLAVQPPVTVKPLQFDLGCSSLVLRLTQWGQRRLRRRKRLRHRGLRC
ncbi:hypothetical protein BCR33DRAFT_324975 [Rhizoclosmatium globosum]|uniref:Uncharacterized protein n=1 Tax=Rhizoclosmatium globosum TaxID=329046 RepID=A0A1Y2D037_9FUNG|nr:hypothetical protein BCR33DRAFT_324975 [Rhizoclosmatium globosum]|eukprot:ORY52659.1 hypothetical protein BCR33DRAFT_324975 [Rhizoclosmatium globosum]